MSLHTWMPCLPAAAAVCLSMPCATMAVSITYQGEQYLPVEGAMASAKRGELIVLDGGLMGAAVPDVPYGLSFEAQMPQPSVGAPDFGVGQVWFSVDYGGEFDRLAFAVRGGKLQDTTTFSYAQRQPPAPVSTTGRMVYTEPPNRLAVIPTFRRLGAQLKPGQWFKVRIVVSGDVVAVEIDGVQTVSLTRALTAGRSFCLGGSWQENRFRDVRVGKLGGSASAIEVVGGLQPRDHYHAQALKLDFGSASTAAQTGWKRASDAVFTPSAEAGWSGATAGVRTRVASGVDARMLSLVALSHDSRKSTFRMAVGAGDYLVSVGVGDAAFATAMDITAPDGKVYPADLASGQWREIRFPVHHTGGTLDIPMDATRSNGGCVCYLVVEPLDSTKSQGIALSSPRASNDHTAEHEAKRRADRNAYRPTKLPRLEGKAAMDVSLDGKWLLKPLQETPASPVDASASDADWHVVNVPSFWNVIVWWIYNQVSLSFEHEETRRCEEQTFDWRNTKTVFYRKWLEVPGDWAGYRVTVDFNAVASACVVYCNGVEVGRNLGMFRPFSVDLTKQIRPGKNLLALMVNNGAEDSSAGPAKIEGIAVTMAVTSDMLKGIPRDIYVGPYGGIWQGVNLHVSRDVRIDDIWPRTELDKLDLVISAKGSCSSLKGASARVRVTDKNGKALVDSTVPWKPGVTEQDSESLHVCFGKLKPKLWSPDSPNLYTLAVDILSGGRVLDSQKCKIGFRTFETSGSQLLLNGKPYRLLGANMAPHGLKPNDRELARKFTALMKQGNQNATRTVCSPYPEVWLDEADAQGIAVSLEGTWSWLMLFQSEIPSDENLQIWKSEWLDLMKKLRKHPSIVMWTINNEMVFLNDTNLDRRAKKWNVLQDAIAAMRKLDPTRPIVYSSGYQRRPSEGGVNEMDQSRLIGKDDGDMDDLHWYAGTYQPSAIGNPLYQKNCVESLMIPGRPLIAQEVGTAYPNTDTGHQARSYISRWHAQAWSGNDAYEHRNPMTFLNRHARITAEQIEAVRRSPIAGWLAFCNGTWYCNVQNAATIAPYPAHASVKRALAPVLVALNMPVRQFFAGADIEPKVFVVNDDAKGKDLKGLSVKLKIESDTGETLAESSSRFPNVPILQNREIAMRVKLPSRLPAQRCTSHLAIELVDSAGKTLATNRYELTLCSPDYARLAKPVTVYAAADGVGAGLTSVLNQNGIDTRPVTPSIPQGALLVMSGISGPAWEQAVQHAQAGGHVVVFDPKDLGGRDIFGKAEIKDVPMDGECANVKNDRTSPLLAGMKNSDLAWWFDTSGDPRVYGRAMIFSGDIPDHVRVLVDHVPPHGYTMDWSVEHPLVTAEVGKGTITVCTMNFAGADRDPLAARFLCNLIGFLESGEAK